MGEELREEYLELLDRSMRGSLDVNELQSGLDRLHTLVTKFLRRLCEERGSSATENKTLHRLLTEYVTNMSAAGAIETEMTERTLRSSIANLEAFQMIINNVDGPLPPHAQTSHAGRSAAANRMFFIADGRSGK